MFTKKQQTADVIRKSSLKVQDPKKDVFARLKHLKTILGETTINSYSTVLVADKKHARFKRAFADNLNFA